MDLVILVIFLICIAYALMKVRDALDDQTKIEFDKADLDAQLKERKLGETSLDQLVEIVFKVKPTDRFSFDYDGKDAEAKNGKQPKFLDLVVNNKSQNANIYVDWDKSSLTGFDNASRRVIRLNAAKQLPNFSLPPAPQAPSVVTPGTKLNASITVEDVLKPNADNTILEPASPLIDLILLRTLSKKKGPDKIPPLVKLQRQFYEERKPIEFYLSLMLRMIDLTHETEKEAMKESMYRLRYRLKISYMPWLDQLPWNPKK